MLLPTSLSQASLAAAFAGSAVGTYLGISPPNPDLERSSQSITDTLDRIKITGKLTVKASLVPLTLGALHLSSLAYTYPDIPSSLLRHGAENGFSKDLITWSPSTAIPLGLILCAGVPLRLSAYASLGKNFTFALAAPSGLNTGGIYRYVQHPSYTGLIALFVSNWALLCRADGPLSCWVPPSWFKPEYLNWVITPAWLTAMMFFMWTRVKQEEGMLKSKFGAEWEEWHAKTARFLPFLF